MMTENNYKAYEREQEDGIDWKDMIYLCTRKWFWFVFSFMIALLAGSYVYLRSTPIYSRYATIMIKDEQGSPSVNSVERQLSRLGIAQSANVSNEMIALQSPALMFEVVKRLHLNTHYMVKGFFHDYTLYGSELPIRVQFLSLGEEDGATMTLTSTADGQFTLTGFQSLNTKDIDNDKVIKGKFNQIVKTPVGKVLVQPSANYQPIDKPIVVNHYPLMQSGIPRVSVSLTDKNATTIDLGITDVSIERADDILNTLMEVYNESWLQDKNQVSINTSKFIDERLRVIEQELGNVEKSITSYKSENLLPDADVASNLYVQKRALNNDKLLELSNQLYMATYVSDLVSKNKNRFELLPANSGINVPSLEAMIANYNKDLLQRNRLVMNSSSTTPIVIELEERIEKQRQTIATSFDNLLVSLRSQKQNLERQEGMFTNQLASAPAKSSYLAAIGREQKVKESLYIFLLQKREENELSLAFTSPIFRVITPPMGSRYPTSPIKRNIFMIAVALGLAIPFTCLFLSERLNGRVRGRKDLERLTLPIIGEIPHMNSEKDGFLRTWKMRLGLGTELSRTDNAEIVVKPQSTNMVNEAFRLVRTNFEFRTNQFGKGAVTMVVSSNVSAGKTFMSMNLAESLVLKGKKVIVVDLDLRKGMASLFVDSPKVGFSHYLNGLCSLEEVVHEYKDTGLKVIPVGVFPPNPTELLYSERLGEAITQLKKEYDYVFVDCPPVEIVADAAIISQHVDQTLFVLRAHLLLKSLLPDIEGYYRSKRYPNMMVVLNDVDNSKMSYGYHRYGRHGYNYYA